MNLEIGPHTRVGRTVNRKDRMETEQEIQQKELQRKVIRAKLGALMTSLSQVRQEVEASKLFDKKVAKYLHNAETAIYNADGVVIDSKVRRYR